MELRLLKILFFFLNILSVSPEGISMLPHAAIGQGDAGEVGAAIHLKFDPPFESRSVSSPSLTASSSKIPVTHRTILPQNYNEVTNVSNRLFNDDRDRCDLYLSFNLPIHVRAPLSIPQPSVHSGHSHVASTTSQHNILDGTRRTRVTLPTKTVTIFHHLFDTGGTEAGVHKNNTIGAASNFLGGSVNSLRWLMRSVVIDTYASNSVHCIETEFFFNISTRGSFNNASLTVWNKTIDLWQKDNSSDTCVSRVRGGNQGPTSLYVTNKDTIAQHHRYNALCADTVFHPVPSFDAGRQQSSASNITSPKFGWIVLVFVLAAINPVAAIPHVEDWRQWLVCTSGAASYACDITSIMVELSPNENVTDTSKIGLRITHVLCALLFVLGYATIKRRKDPIQSIKFLVAFAALLGLFYRVLSSQLPTSDDSKGFLIDCIVLLVLLAASVIIIVTPDAAQEIAGQVGQVGQAGQAGQDEQDEQAVQARPDGQV
ncbi:hypothetical protein F5B20DRAFT_120081 [Whalleya microplaca]|nr:hypothetical protein F5B20DRAFT_120081 [Whalleya microplaca]